MPMKIEKVPSSNMVTVASVFLRDIRKQVFTFMNIGIEEQIAA